MTLLGYLVLTLSSATITKCIYPSSRWWSVSIAEFLV